VERERGREGERDIGKMDGNSKEEGWLNKTQEKGDSGRLACACFRSERANKQKLGSEPS
jgi:hypothetical protein